MITHVFKCDLCDWEIEVKESAYPEDWQEVRVTSRSSYGHYKFMVCPSCWSKGPELFKSLWKKMKCFVSKKIKSMSEVLDQKRHDDLSHERLDKVYSEFEKL